ncbi:MAG: hypothetical protein AAGF51_14625 [Pseudomonadota bacterium]
MNITRSDIIGFTDLTPEEVDAIAEHEHIAEVAAAALGNYLLGKTGGVAAIRTMIVDDIKAALARGDDKHAADLFMALRHLHEAHDPVP